MKTVGEIALVDKLEKLAPVVGFNANTTEISVAIGKLAEDGKPRNWSIDYETPKTSVGGCFARIFATEFGEGLQANIFSWYGPALNYPDLRDYQHGLRAMERIARKLDGMHKDRGATVDAADCLGRWLEACAVKAVYLRPDGESDQRWHTKGEWLVLTIGDFVNRARRNLYFGPIKADAIAGGKDGAR
jgi:hypothetical protein